MEPERKIEKLLRTYAKKRRADAGDPLTLHPATRRLLQGEVARRSKEPDKEEASISLWELFQRQWALLAGFAMVVLVGTALFLPALSSARKKSKTVATLTDTRQVSEPTNLGSSQLLAANDSLSRQLPEPAVILKDAEGNAAVASPVAGQPKSETDRSDAKLADSGAVTAAGGTLAANAPAAAPPAVDGLAKAPGAAGGDFKTTAGMAQFANATQNYNSGVQNSFKNTIAPAKAAAVLVNFQVQQNGNTIRVVDADGSVYDGALQPENMVTQKEQVSTVAGSLPVDREKSITSQDESQTTQNYFFRVAGTNLTLKQNVVFAGNLQANFSAAAKGQQANNRNDNFTSGGAGHQLQSAITDQLPWSNSRIAGTAVVSDTNTIEINAVPQAP